MTKTHTITFKHPINNNICVVENWGKESQSHIVGGGNSGLTYADIEKLGLVISSEEYVAPVPTVEELEAQEAFAKAQKERVEKAKEDKAKEAQSTAPCSCKAEIEALTKRIDALEKEVKASPSPQPSPQPTGKAGKPPVNINTENDVKKIAGLPNISDAKAPLLIEERQKNGKFKDKADLISRLRLIERLPFEGLIAF